MSTSVFVTGPSVSRKGLTQYTHLIRSSSDPERSSGRRKDKFPHRTLAKLPPSEIRSLLLGGLADGTPRTFNRLGVELFDMTGSRGDRTHTDGTDTFSPY